MLVRVLPIIGELLALRSGNAARQRPAQSFFNAHVDRPRCAARDDEARPADLGAPWQQHDDVAGRKDAFRQAFGRVARDKAETFETDRVDLHEHDLAEPRFDAAAEQVQQITHRTVDAREQWDAPQ